MKSISLIVNCLIFITLDAYASIYKVYIHNSQIIDSAISMYVTMNVFAATVFIICMITNITALFSCNIDLAYKISVNRINCVSLRVLVSYLVMSAIIVSWSTHSGNTILFISKCTMLLSTVTQLFVFGYVVWLKKYKV